MSLSTRRKLIFSAASLVVVMVGLEVVLRLTTSTLGRATIPEETVLAHVKAESLVYDPLYGWVRSPIPDPIAGVDRHGFRTVEPFEDAKPPGTWRAFTFGDSQTFGAGVEVDQSYPAVALRALRRERPDQPIEVINTALSGYGSLQALRLIQHKVLALSPDLLIVDCRTYDQPRDEVAVADPRFPAIDRLLFQWRTWYVLRFAIERARGTTAPMRPEAMERRGDSYVAGNHDNILRVAEEAGVPLVFLDYPFWNMPRSPADAAPALPQDDISCMAPASRLPPGAQVVSICEPLKASGLPAETLFLDNNHLSVEGNRIAGEALAHGLLPWLPQPPP